MPWTGPRGRRDGGRTPGVSPDRTARRRRHREQDPRPGEGASDRDILRLRRAAAARQRDRAQGHRGAPAARGASRRPRLLAGPQAIPGPRSSLRDRAGAAARLVRDRLVLGLRLRPVSRSGRPHRRDFRGRHGAVSHRGRIGRRGAGARLPLARRRFRSHPRPHGRGGRTRLSGHSFPEGCERRERGDRIQSRRHLALADRVAGGGLSLGPGDRLEGARDPRRAGGRDLRPGQCGGHPRICRRRLRPCC